MKPPSTIISAPVMKDDSSDAKNSAALAMSRGWPMRPSGMPVLNSTLSSGVRYGACSGVSTIPGWMMLERIWSLANWMASDLLSEMRAPFAAVYASCARVKPASAETDEDDGAAAGLLEMRDAVLGDPEHALEVDGHDAVPLRAVGLEHRAVLVLPQDTRVVVEDVERAEALHALVDHPLHVLFDRHVAHGRLRLAARLLDERDRLVGGAPVDVAHDDASALGGEENGGLAAHAHAGAGDQRGLTLEPVWHPRLSRRAS